jgi:hypothetical protein
MGNCCAHLLYKISRSKDKLKSTDSNIPSNIDEAWGDWDDIEAAPSSIAINDQRAGCRLNANNQQPESVPFIHPNTIKASQIPTTPSTLSTTLQSSQSKLLKAKAGWVVKEKTKKQKGRIESSFLEGFSKTKDNTDPFSSMGMTANYTDNQKIQPKKQSTGALIGSGARSLEEDVYEEGEGWGNDDEEEDI